MNTELKSNLLSSLENHGKCNLTGLYKLYPHYQKKEIDECLELLQTEGWVVIRQTQIIDGIRAKIPNVKRSKKQMWTQQKLIA